MARMHLQRLASTYIFSLCAGPQGFVKASRTLNSSSQTLCRPSINWWNKYSPGICGVPASTHFNPLVIPHSEHNQGWSSAHSPRYCCMKMYHEDDEVSVPKDRATPSAKKTLDGAAKFNVIRINDDGSWHHLSLKTSELVSAVSFHCSLFLAFKLPSAYFLSF